MQANIRLGRIWNIPIGLNYSWFLIFGLVTWSLATGFLPSAYPGLSITLAAALGLLTSILFFASVLAHELGHAFIALRNSIPVRAINLFFFGGVAQITREPQSAGAEFRIAIAGPLVSLALAALFGFIALLAPASNYLDSSAMWLARINLILALFNLIPGFPLDGGRVLRAIVWQATGNEMRATRVAGLLGQITAFSFIGIGVLLSLTGNFANGLWLVFIGWFLQNAAASSIAQAGLRTTLAGVTASQVMSRTLVRVPSQTPVGSLVETEMLGAGQRAFFVSDDESVRGMVTLTDIARLPRPVWETTPVERIMAPEERWVRIAPDTELLAAIETMETANVKQLPVVAEGRIIGLLSREQALNFLRLRAEVPA
jgi:Zn-dependent protease